MSERVDKLMSARSSAEVFWVGLALFLACFAAVYAAGLSYIDDGRIDRLERRVACLEHPHGESSIAVQLRPSYKVIQPAARTGCERGR